MKKLTKEELENRLLPRKVWYCVLSIMITIGIVSPIVFGIYGLLETLLSIIWCGILYLDIKLRNKFGIKK